MGLAETLSCESRQKTKEKTTSPYQRTERNLHVRLVCVDVDRADGIGGLTPRTIGFGEFNSPSVVDSGAVFIGLGELSSCR